MQEFESPVGFIGLGIMGTPMALNVLRAGIPLLVWNRTHDKMFPLLAAGAQAADNSDDVFATCELIFLMLADSEAIDEVVSRGTAADFRRRVHGRTIVNMGTASPAFSRSLAEDVADAGGQYMECPVSGSRTPAERGELIAMIAGNVATAQRITPVLKPIAREVYYCGAAPNASLMKLAVNLFLITSVTGLAEATNFATQNRLDIGVFQRIVDAGPMASSFSKTKVDKMSRRDFSVQAACCDVFMNTVLITRAAREANIHTPLMDDCRTLFDRTIELGNGALDMAAILLAFGEPTSPHTKTCPTQLHPRCTSRTERTGEHAEKRSEL